MKEFVVRLYDAHVRTNYVERIIKAPTRRDVFQAIQSHQEITEEIEAKFKYNKSIQQIVENSNFEIIERLPEPR
jgi:hypothetical protein